MAAAARYSGKRRNVVAMTIERLQPLGRAADLADDHVVLAGAQPGQDRGPRGADEFRLQAQLRGQQPGDVDVVAGQLATVGILETERWMGVPSVAMCSVPRPLAVASRSAASFRAWRRKPRWRCWRMAVTDPNLKPA